MTGFGDLGFRGYWGFRASGLEAFSLLFSLRWGVWGWRFKFLQVLALRAESTFTQPTRSRPLKPKNARLLLLLLVSKVLVLPAPVPELQVRSTAKEKPKTLKTLNPEP